MRTPPPLQTLQIQLVDMDALRDLMTEIARRETAIPEVMTAQQVAKYFQVSKSSVMRWTKDVDDPLPVGYFGSEPRFYREDVREWSRRKAVKRLIDETN